MKITSWIVMGALLLCVGCAGMEKPNLNKPFQSEEKLTKSTKVTTTEKRSTNNPIMRLDAWMRENMW